MSADDNIYGPRREEEEAYSEGAHWPKPGINTTTLRYLTKRQVGLEITSEGVKLPQVQGLMM
jgi:hypothetical protein